MQKTAQAYLSDSVGIDLVDVRSEAVSGGMQYEHCSGGSLRIDGVTKYHAQLVLPSSPDQGNKGIASNANGGGKYFDKQGTGLITGEHPIQEKRFRSYYKIICNLLSKTINP